MAKHTSRLRLPRAFRVVSTLFPVYVAPALELRSADGVAGALAMQGGLPPNWKSRKEFDT